MYPSPSIIIFCFVLLLTMLGGGTSQLGYHCDNSPLYKKNSKYQLNLKSLLGDLVSNVTRSGGFFNTTAGSGDSTVYGRFICRGDISLADCQSCIEDAAKEILSTCHAKIAARICYRQCTLDYSSNPLFGIEDIYKSPVVSCGSQKSSEPQRFMGLLENALNTMADAVVEKREKFVTLQANVFVSKTIFMLGQCTPDLSKSECRSCLGQSIRYVPLRCYSALGAEFILASCHIKYDTYPLKKMLPLTPMVSPAPLRLPVKGSSRKSSLSVAIVATIVPLCGIVLAIATFYLLRVKLLPERRNETSQPLSAADSIAISSMSSRYDFATVKIITNDFACEIGRGGYGCVYKGNLPTGQEVAVKKLYTTTQHGVQSFVNEVETLLKLQHRNLVQLLGYCCEATEKILIYEFVPNKSLDAFIFGRDPQFVLDWSTRYKIMKGIARGLLYLHEDSCLKVIHRDLKADNILLDTDMNPKIADFGLARILSSDQSVDYTETIVGTEGYMSPEFYRSGRLSVKYDIYSFGVLILEVISGERIRGFNGSLPSNAWDCWMDGKPLEIVDQALRQSYTAEEVIQWIHIGLLSVQADADKRPTMQEILSMVTHYSRNNWAVPCQPSYTIDVIAAGRQRLMTSFHRLMMSLRRAWYI